MKKILMLIAILAIAAILSGCGGGGGGAGQGADNGPSTLQGVAVIHSDTVRPRIGILKESGNTFESVQVLQIARAKSGWEEIVWSGLKLPSNPASGAVYSIAAFDDSTVDDNKYETSELLGFCDLYLVYSSGTWKLYDENGNFIKKALDARSTDIFIDSIYKSAETFGVAAKSSGAGAMSKLSPDQLKQIEDKKLSAFKQMKLKF